MSSNMDVDKVETDSQASENEAEDEILNEAGTLPEGVALTENGAIAHKSTGTACLNLFSQTVRNMDEASLTSLIQQSWNESPLDTLKIMFYCRDCRGGKGEKKLFQTFLKFLSGADEKDAKVKKSDVLKHNIKHIPFFGKWKDLLFVLNPECGASAELQDEAAKFFAGQLVKDKEIMTKDPKKSVSLAAKWAPTENGHEDKKGKAPKKIRKFLKNAQGVEGVSKAEYRKMYIVPLRKQLKIVESLMSAKKWNEIDYQKVPGVCMKKEKKAFQRNDEERFIEYSKQLEQGKVKVNAATVDVHDLVRENMMKPAQDAINEAQWLEVVKRVKGYGMMDRALVMSDVSGSMSGTPMEVSIALGILISTLTAAPFTNQVMTFDSNPTFFEITGKSLFEKVKQLQTAPWGGSTNLMAAFHLILDTAKKFNLPADQMPNRLYIISDMQFDCAAEGGNWSSTHDNIVKLYDKAGYKVPEIVYWNVRSTDNYAAQEDTPGVAMVSGFSSAILKSLLQGKIISPYDTMRSAIDDKRYQCLHL